MARTPQKDIVWTSHKILQPACEKWLRGRGAKSVFFPGEWRMPQKINSHYDILDIVLFGDFVDEISKYRKWPLANHYRIWVLSSSVKKFCVHGLAFKNSEIGVIPRSAIMKTKDGLKFPLRDQRFSLVYGGRLVMRKNFDVFLKLASYLQTQLGFKKMRVVASGPFGESSLQFDYLLLKLPWITPPTIITDSGSQDWTKKIKGAKVYANLSRHRREDFGVSVSEAQSLGWPMLLSDWGGHRDVQGTNIIKVPARLLPDSDLVRSVKDPIEEKKLAKLILARWGKSSSTKKASVSIRQPALVTIETIKKIELEVLKDLRRTPFQDWIQTPKGKKLRTIFDRCFGLS